MSRFSPTFEHIQDEIAAMLAIPDDELSDEQNAAMDAYLDMLGEQEAGKVDAFAFFLKEQAAKADFFREEGKRISDKARAIENKIAWLKGKYTEIMYRHGLKKISGDAYTISLRESESVRVPEDRLLEIPPEFLVEKYSVAPDKTAIKAALEEGREVPGCSIQKNFYLNIR